MRSGLNILENDAVLDVAAPARPAWLRVKAPGAGRTTELQRLLSERRLHTVCSSAACPNIGDCWAAGTATFMILGNECTRACRFCDVKTAKDPMPVDLDEAERLADAVELMGLKHVVITSVARDDLEDGGARQFARCMRAVRARTPGVTLEVLVPDFQGSRDSIAIVLDERPAVFNHNLETCERLTPAIRSGAVYSRSLDVLVAAKALHAARASASASAPAAETARIASTSAPEPAPESAPESALESAPESAPESEPGATRMRTKTGVMLGLGETDDEVRATIRDARAAQVDILTIGQYLRPSSWNAPVARYVEPAVFAELGAYARSLGFAHVESGPLVRSSYHAERALPGGPVGNAL